MSARANIAVNDGEGSPVTHTFTPNGDAANEVMRYRNLNATVPAASEVITLSVKDSPASLVDISTPGKKISPRSVEFRLSYPATYVDGVSGLTLVDFVDLAVVQFLIHPRSIEQRCENLRTMVINALTQANGNQILYAVDKGEHVW
jgi:hypothetical protein